MNKSIIIATAIKKVRTREAARAIERDKERAEYIAEWDAKKARAASQLAPRLRSTDLQDYLDWLGGFILAGGEPTHAYDYTMRTEKWFVAKQDIDAHELCGAASINVIVPNGIAAPRDGWGHCGIYFMDGFDHVGHSVPIYSDIQCTSQLEA